MKRLIALFSLLAAFAAILPVASAQTQADGTPTANGTAPDAAAPKMGKKKGKAKAKMGPRPRLSPHDTVSVNLGDGHYLEIVYGRPYTRDPHAGEANGKERTVWGGELVKLNEIWRTGADEATLLITPVPITLHSGSQSLKIPAGVVSLYSYPNSVNNIMLVVNKQFGQWGLEYHEDLDLGRIALTRATLSPAIHQFTIKVGKSDQKAGLISLQWEDAQYTIEFSIDSDASPAAQ